MGEADRGPAPTRPAGDAASVRPAHGGDPPGWGAESYRVGWVLRVLGGTRYLIVLAVAGLAVSAGTLLVYAAIAVGATVWRTLGEGTPSTSGVKRLTIDFIELADAFLLGSVLVIVALGLYELFVEPDLPVPPWLRVTDLDQLKGKLTGVLVVLLGVTFLPYVVDWDGRSTILHAGVAVAAVISAFAFHAWIGGKGGGGGGATK